VAFVVGAHGEIRTPDPRLRRPMLYPAELRAHEPFDHHTYRHDLNTIPSSAGHRSGGERGIRTLDGLLTHTPLAGARLRPLGHLSAHQPCGPWSQPRLRRALLRTSCTSPFGPSFIRFATGRCSKLLQAILSTTRPSRRSLTGHFHIEGHGPRQQLAKARGDPTRKARKDTDLSAIRKA
jgi:hypothetical protein